jgi:hypothetical protein
LAEDRLPFLRASLQIKVVRGATGEVAQEQFVGADQTVADGTWTDKVMVRDHENARYSERVVREGDGVVVRDVDEPLSEHRGRGSDRPDRRAARAAIKAQQQAERAARKALRDEEWRASQRARDLDRS